MLKRKNIIFWHRITVVILMNIKYFIDYFRTKCLIVQNKNVIQQTEERVPILPIYYSVLKCYNCPVR